MTLLEEGLLKLGICGGNAGDAKPLAGVPLRYPPPGLDKAGVPLQILNLLGNYIEEIELFNPAYGLVKVKDRRELIVKHILDSLAPVNIIRRLPGAGLQGKPEVKRIADVGSGAGLQGKPEVKRIADVGSGAGLQGKPEVKRIADVGSGAGLPGIPLAICMPGAEFTLIERMGRRAGFLRDALAVLSLPNVIVEENDMQVFANRLPENGRFDLVVFRAFKPLEPGILKGLLKLLLPGGIIAAYKGRRQSAEEEMIRWKTLDWELIPLEVPFLDTERHLLLIHAP